MFMETSLIIQVLAEEHANKLINEIFSLEPSLSLKVVRGSLSGTFGIKIGFKAWYKSIKAVPEFLFGEKVEKITSMKPSELGYYEILPDIEELDIVPFYELFPVAGYYKFGKKSEFEFEPSTEYIYYRGNRTYKITDIFQICGWVHRNPDQRKISGLSKLYRRGFISMYDDLYERWSQELKDILQDC